MYAALQQGIVDYLETEEDIFGLPVIPDAPPNTEETVDLRLKQEGIVLIVGKPRQTARGTHEVVVQIPMMILENDVVNRTGDDGLNREPEQVLADLISSLDRYQTQEFWTPIVIRPFDPRDPEYGHVAWGVVIETHTLLPREFAILVDHNGNAICDHNFKVILTTNRGRTQ
jgi:hypothetical protein